MSMQKDFNKACHSKTTKLVIYGKIIMKCLDGCFLTLDLIKNFYSEKLSSHRAKSKG